MAPEKYLCVVDVGASSSSSNVESAHNTTKYFAPTYSEVVNLTVFAINKGLSASSDKR
jgi:hypothetical protein